MVAAVVRFAAIRSVKQMSLLLRCCGACCVLTSFSLMLGEKIGLILFLALLFSLHGHTLFALFRSNEVSFFFPFHEKLGIVNCSMSEKAGCAPHFSKSLLNFSLSLR